MIEDTLRVLDWLISKPGGLFIGGIGLGAFVVYRFMYVPARAAAEIATASLNKKLVDDVQYWRGVYEEVTKK